MSIIERIVAIIADLKNNGIDGAAGVLLVGVSVVALLVFGIFRAAVKNNCSK